MISYCIAAYRPILCKLLVQDLVRKTSVPYEILVWNNTGDIAFENFLVEQSRAGARVNIVGSSADNIGMRAYQHLFKAAQYPLIVQIDDDVVCVSRNIAQICTALFAKHPKVRQIVSDIWVDDLTWGNKPPKTHYKPWNDGDQLLRGPVDGWFSVMHKSVMPLILEKVKFGKFFSLGLEVRAMLEKHGLLGLLCQQFKVFHVVGGPYLSYYGMLEAEGRKWEMLKGPGAGRKFVEKMSKGVPPRDVLEKKVQGIYAALDVMGASA